MRQVLGRFFQFVLYFLRLFMNFWIQLKNNLTVEIQFKNKQIIRLVLKVLDLMKSINKINRENNNFLSNQMNKMRRGN